MPLLLLALAIITACRRTEPTRRPSEAVVAALHASAFYYQSGAIDAGEQRRREAHSLTPSEIPDSTTTSLLERLDRMAVLSSTADDERARLAEHPRFSLADGSCLPPALHESLHRELPAIPAAR